ARVERQLLRALAVAAARPHADAAVEGERHRRTRAVAAREPGGRRRVAAARLGGDGAGRPEEDARREIVVAVVLGLLGARGAGGSDHGSEGGEAEEDAEERWH